VQDTLLSQSYKCVKQAAAHRIIKKRLPFRC